MATTRIRRPRPRRARRSGPLPSRAHPRSGPGGSRLRAWPRSAYSSGNREYGTHARTPAAWMAAESTTMSTIASPQPTVRKARPPGLRGRGHRHRRAHRRGCDRLRLARRLRRLQRRARAQRRPPTDSVTVGAPKAARRDPRSRTARRRCHAGRADGDRPGAGPGRAGRSGCHRHVRDGRRAGRQHRRHPDRSRLRHGHGPRGRPPPWRRPGRGSTPPAPRAARPARAAAPARSATPSARSTTRPASAR